MVTFRVLGRVAAGDVEYDVPASPLRRVFLAMLLARSNRVVSADRLIDALWPEEDVEAARNRLWFHTSKLRSELADPALADRLETHDTGYRISIQDGELDAALFEEEAASGNAHLGSDPEHATSLLRRALDRWHGRAFGDAGDHPSLSADVVRLVALRIRAGEDLAQALIRLEQYEETVQLLRDLLLIDPYREQLRSQLMVALYATGRQVEALEVYDESIELMRNDLGLDPSPLLRSTGLRILRHDPTLVPGPPGKAPRISFPKRRPCVGREQEVAEAGDTLRPGDAGSTLLISGEAGVGKTSLLAEAAVRAVIAEPQLLVAAGVGVAAPGLPDDFGPLRQVLGALVGDLEASVAVELMTQAQVDALWAATPVALDALCDVGAGLIGKLIDPASVQARAASTQSPMNEDLERLIKGHVLESEMRPSLIRQVVSLLSRIAASRPLLLVLDDLHRADRTTVEVLTAIAHARANPALSAIGAFRPGAAEHAGMSELLSSVGEHQLIDLDSGDENARRAFVDALVDLEPNELDEEFRNELTLATAGRALFVVEWLRSLVDRGELVRTPDGALRAEPSVSFAAWPRQVASVIADRLGTFSAPEREMLRVAAVEGESFTADVVAHVTGRTLDTVVAFLSADVGDHVVAADVPSHIGALRTLRYRFTHQLYQRYLYSALDSAERSLLHERVANALVALGVGDDDAHALVLAEHFVSAGMDGDAARYLHRAAMRQTRLGDNRGAVALLDRALRLLAPYPLPDAAESTARIYTSRGIALSALRGFTDASVEDAFSAAIDLLGDRPSASEAMRAYWGLGVMYLSRADFDAAEAILERMVYDPQAENLPAMPRSHLRWTLDLFQGRTGDALESTRRGREEYRYRRDHPLTFDYGNHDPGVCAGSIGGLVRALRGETALARQWAADAGDLAASLDHGPSASQARTFAMWVDHVAGDHEAVVTSGEHTPTQAAPLWDLLAQALMAHSLAVTNGSDATATLTNTLDAQLEMNDIIFGAVTASLLAEQWMRGDEPGRAAATIQRIRSLHRNLESYVWAPEILRSAGEAARALGNGSEGDGLIRQAAAVADGMGATTLADRARTSLANSS